MQATSGLTSPSKACWKDSAAACSDYEINIITKPAYRQRGMAKAVAAKFIAECLGKNMEPHRDGANDASKCLATQLRYALTGTYEVQYVL